MLKFGTPTIALPLAIKKCTVQTGCTVYVMKKKFVIERSRDLIYLKFVATDFSPKIIGRAKRAPHWGVQSRFRVIYVGMSVVVQKSVGGITWAKRAHALSQYWAVQSYQ